MVFNVKTFDSNKLLGYLINDYYVNLDSYDLLVKKIFNVAGDITARYLNENVVIFGSVYKPADEELMTTYEDFAPSVRGVGVVPQDFIFIRSSCNKFNKDETSRFWSELTRLDKSITHFSYKIYDTRSRKIVAYMDTSADLYKTKYININMFEVLDKHNGIGTEIIDMLVNSNYVLTGLSTAEAKIFWSKVGAVFEDNLNHFIVDFKEA